jgi:hypothetical protein
MQELALLVLPLSVQFLIMKYAMIEREGLEVEISFKERQFLVCKGFLNVEASRSHSDTPHSAGCREFYRTIYDAHNKQTSIPLARFEIAVPSVGVEARLPKFSSWTLDGWEFYVSEKKPRYPLNWRLGYPRKGLDDSAENKLFF